MARDDLRRIAGGRRHREYPPEMRAGEPALVARISTLEIL
jgi:hypothetical protein